jgi:multicomponent Na+:H+ antiporter subunit E
MIRSLPRFALLTLVFFGVWLGLSGQTDLFHLALGAVICLAVSALAFPWRARRPFPLLRFMAFLPWALWQVILSNLAVARLVLSRRPAIAPHLVTRRPAVQGNRALTVLGALITLPPGTLTVEITQDLLIIHALDDPSAAPIVSGEFARRVRKVFGQEEPAP